MKTSSSTAPIIAVFLLLLPVIYVGSYLLLVVPAGFGRNEVDNWGHRISVVRFYRIGGDRAERFFRPLQRLDQWVRPKAWGDNLHDD
jgi:hypothetical protein